MVKKNNYPQYRHKWTSLEEEKLRAKYFTSDKEVLLKMFPQTTWNTIQTKASELGLTGKRKDWTKAEIDTLKTNYPQYPVKISKQQLLDLLPLRTWSAILIKALKLSINCIWIWTEEENKILQDNYSRCTRKEMQKFLPNRNWESIASQAHHLGLHQNKKKFGPGYRWSQHKTLDIIDFILAENALRDCKYSWMRSPKGYPLEMDGYYPIHNLAVEFQGQHHYKQGYLGHKTLIYQQQCDQIKRDAIKARGIQLLEVKYDEPIAEEHLKTRLEQLGY